MRRNKQHGKGGSSPLTRGKRPVEGYDARSTRLIPAHAGKTVLGSHVGPVLHGSSPLTRGKLAEKVLQAAEMRLIPAHAGKTRADHGRRDRPRAHPRSRGENEGRLT